MVDPEAQAATDGPALPTRGSDEFKPFIRCLPEFKFWIEDMGLKNAYFSTFCCLLLFYFSSKCLSAELELAQTAQVEADVVATGFCAAVGDGDWPLAGYGG
ncbi:hypothetical protein E2562_016837 [Oryza meyeriana var. granulata]|uniref:Uncharacterized protein n=1 Tax=Oryza meyeriana var. granulata TaxID=110450 RepID=A0A6G1BXW4_9ORYZ|nr:hypothetical protein E2562_016837 [Oryza meyeriana var. granulata]